VFSNARGPISPETDQGELFLAQGCLAGDPRALRAGLWRPPYSRGPLPGGGGLKNYGAETCSQRGGFKNRDHGPPPRPGEVYERPAKHLEKKKIKTPPRAPGWKQGQRNPGYWPPQMGGAGWLPLLGIGGRGPQSGLVKTPPRPGRLGSAGGRGPGNRPGKAMSSAKGEKLPEVSWAGWELQGEPLPQPLSSVGRKTGGPSQPPGLWALGQAVGWNRRAKTLPKSFLTKRPGVKETFSGRKVSKRGHRPPMGERGREIWTTERRGWRAEAARAPGSGFIQ